MKTDNIIKSFAILAAAANKAPLPPLKDVADMRLEIMRHNGFVRFFSLEWWRWVRTKMSS
ncbi:MAG: hypothetical protein K6U74_00145 [Firmicutes bacterium]|nr:hypothetical protein [Bacillota bacterium]